MTENSKGRPRLLIIDPDLRIGVDANQVLPFIQTIVGTVEPISPRLMILSSLGAAFPANITNGVAASTSVFAWNLNAKSVGDPATQAKIITAMESFMTEYMLWADAGFPSHPSQKGDLNDAQDDFKTYTNNLLFKP